ncbi:E3 ubiquitin-protein ligase TRIM7-like [Engystomops pustulosus]|uniref:E3 ubiquitin-protein ligase TRIM7-like n=1 Tax=Engystomops pustulosus TaxID=76066 RepID=UPI003AFB33BA
MEETRVCCTYCDSPEPAVRTCLQCEASFCEKHLQRHSKSSEHILVDPDVNLEERKCSTHKEALKYYCPMDSSCICVSCWVAGDHKGHEVEILDVASEKKKGKLRSAVEKMNSDKMEAGRRIQNLTDHGVEEEKQLSGLTEKVTNLFTDLRKKLDDLESRVLGEISRQKNRVSLLVSYMIKQMELHKDELSKKIHQFEESCDITDPLTILQEDLIRGDISDQSYDVRDVKAAQCRDDVIVLQMLHRGLLRFADDLNNIGMKREFPVMEKSEVLLDIDSANNYIIISEDLRSASYTSTSQNRPDGPKRFKGNHVFSSCTFSSGRHYWEVDVSQAKQWIIGVAGESLERKENRLQTIFLNQKFWAVTCCKKLIVSHNNMYRHLETKSPVKVVGIYLDYEAGRLSFYQLCDPIRLLYTFTTSFSEPLYPAFHVLENCMISIIK